MFTRCNPVLLCSGILFAVLVFSGCTAVGIGHAGYANDTISLTVMNDGGPSDGYVQVTVYEIKNDLQEKTDIFYAPLTLQQGENTAFIPGTLGPGQYKLYFYIFQNGERKAAAIRDIVVN